MNQIDLWSLFCYTCCESQYGPMWLWNQFSPDYLLLCSTEAIMSYMFVTAWGWVNNNRIVVLVNHKYKSSFLFNLWFLVNLLRGHYYWNQMPSTHLNGQIFTEFCQNASFGLKCKLVHYVLAALYTVMAKNIGTLAILSENTTLLSENCSNCKCFGIHMLIVFVCTATTKKKTEKKSQNV